MFVFPSKTTPISPSPSTTSLMPNFDALIEPPQPEFNSMEIAFHLQNLENKCEEVNVAETEAVHGDLKELMNYSMETQVADVLNDTEELDSPCPTEGSPTKMLDGYDTEVVPDSDDEISDTIESKMSSHRRVRLAGRFVNDLDKVDPAFYPSCEKLEHSNINADACYDGRNVLSHGQTGCATVFQASDSCLVIGQYDIHDTEQNDKNKEISGVDDPCSASAPIGDMNGIENVEKLSEDSKVIDCGRISQSKRSDVCFVYTRKRRRTRNFEVNGVEDGKCSSDKIEEYAGLSYVESQEPEDISKALLFIDQFVGLNAVLSSPVSNITAREKSQSMESGKGLHNITRLANLRNREENCRVFEWNDSDEQSDQSCKFGQLSSRKKKNDQVYVRRSRSRSLVSNEIGNPMVFQKKKTEKVKNLTQTDVIKCSDGQMVEQLCEIKASVDCNVLDQEVNDESIAMQLETGLIQEESENTFDVGIDTQMAAEAIQAFSFSISMECSVGDDANCQQKMLNKSLEGSLISENWSFPRKVRSDFRGTVSRRKKRKRFPVFESRVTKIPSSKPKVKLNKKRVGAIVDRVSNNSLIVDVTHKRKLNGGATDKFDGSKENLRSFLSTEQSSPHKVKCLGRHGANEPKEAGIVHALHGNDSVAKRKMLSEHLSGCTVALQPDREEENGFPSTFDDGNNKANPTIQVNKNLISESVSPRKMIGNYHAQHVKKKASPSTFTRELARLGFGEAMPEFTLLESRRRRRMSSIQVLLSKNLDKRTYNQQKKILEQLGVPMVSSSSVATHFISDKFARTKNMLEFIALGKPVVTHLWLESCQQAGCFIDETSYILRDIKREQEFGFKLPLSLDRARKHPLLEGYKVIVTPNTKPGQDMVTSLVKIVHGQVVDLFPHKIISKKTIPNNLLILSCEEDRALCLPFLEKGASAYCSELLLNGIIIQKLEFERHRLFTEHVISH